MGSTGEGCTAVTQAETMVESVTVTDPAFNNGTPTVRSRLRAGCGARRKQKAFLSWLCPREGSEGHSKVTFLGSGDLGLGACWSWAFEEWWVRGHRSREWQGLASLCCQAGGRLIGKGGENSNSRALVATGAFTELQP